MKWVYPSKRRIGSHPLIVTSRSPLGFEDEVGVLIALSGGTNLQFLLTHPLNLKRVVDWYFSVTGVIRNGLPTVSLDRLGLQNFVPSEYCVMSLQGKS